MNINQKIINDYDNCWKVSDNRIIVYKGIYYGIVDSDGKVVVPCRYITLKNFKGIYFAIKGFQDVSTDKYYRLLDSNGIRINHKVYNYINPTRDGIVISREGKSGFLAYDGNKFPCIFDGVYDYDNKEQLLIVGNYDESEQDILFGYADKTGKIVIPCKYTSAGLFNNGLSAVSKSDEDDNISFGYIDNKGNTVIDFKYECTRTFDDNGIAIVDITSKSVVLINKQSKVLSKMYSNIYKSDDKKYYIVNDLEDPKLTSGRVGLIDNVGNEILSPNYYSIEVSNNFARVTKHNKKYLIDLDNPKDLISFTNEITHVGSRNDTLRYVKYKGTLILNTGCFIGTLFQFANAVKTHYSPDSIYYKQYMNILNTLELDLNNIND